MENQLLESGPQDLLQNHRIDLRATDLNYALQNLDCGNNLCTLLLCVVPNERRLKQNSELEPEGERPQGQHDDVGSSSKCEGAGTRPNGVIGDTSCWGPKQASLQPQSQTPKHLRKLS